MSLLLLLGGTGSGGAPTPQPYATNLAIGLPALRIETPSPLTVTANNPTKLKIKLPPLKVRKVR